MDILHLMTVFGAEEPQGIAALGIDWLAILAQAFTFLVLFFIIKKFAMDKIITTLENRRKTIEDGIRLGREMEAEKQKLDDKVAKALKDARVEADKIIASSHEEAGGVLKQAEESASAKTDAMIAEASARIEENIKKAKQDLEKETKALIADATEAILRAKLDEKSDQKLLKQVFEEARVKK